MSPDVEGLRWNVERPAGYREDGRFEDVGAHHFKVTDGGALVFFDEGDDVLVAYAPHAWSTVTEG